MIINYPIKAERAPGWHFRGEEKSAGHYVVEGRDAFGRIVSHEGSDYDELLKRCIADAADINRQISN